LPDGGKAGDNTMTTPKCRLFLVVPSGMEAGAARDCLSAALAAGDVAALKVTGTVSQQERLLATLQGLAQDAGVAVLCEDDVDLAAERRTDGVEIEGNIERIAAIRRRLGADAIVGVRCGASRHAAMEMAEAGADYVAFEAGSGGGLIAWWAELFTLPCVAIPAPETTREVIASGADFVVVPAQMWASPEAAGREVATLMNEIAESPQ
jgi:thiamine-phosphate pyrophosphorylase